MKDDGDGNEDVRTGIDVEKKTRPLQPSKKRTATKKEELRLTS